MPSWIVEFERELERVLPSDIPHRERLIRKASHHLNLILAANEYMNLTRITSPEEAAIKHIYDSVAPWQSFASGRRILDVGTGAGFPGVPLAIILPEVRFTLAESVHKKARFLDAAVDELELSNVQVIAERAEQASDLRLPDIITARAVAPLIRLLPLFGSVLKRGSRLLLYKGPDVESEIAEAAGELKKFRASATVRHRYELPNELGKRTLVEVVAQNGPRKAL